MDTDCIVAVALIELHFEETGKAQDRIDCPACGVEKALSYTRGQRSMWARCSTKGCLNFHADMKE